MRDQMKRENKTEAHVRRFSKLCQRLPTRTFMGVQFMEIGTIRYRIEW